MTAAWKLVPVEPVLAQAEALADEVNYQCGCDVTADAAIHGYREAMKAAPPPPETVLTDEERDAAMKRAMARWDDSCGQGLQVVTADEIERAILRKLGGSA